MHREFVQNGSHIAADRHFLKDSFRPGNQFNDISFKENAVPNSQAVGKEGGGSCVTVMAQEPLRTCRI